MSSSVVYGEGQDENYDTKDQVVSEDITKLYDFSDECEKLKKNMWDYHIHKITFGIGTEQRIQSIKIDYKDRNSGEIKTLIDTENSHLENEKLSEIVFNDFEEIKLLRFWVKKDRLIGFSIETNEGQIKKIGYGEDSELLKDKSLETNDYRIVGLSFHANKKFGITGMFFHYMHKSKYGRVIYNGILRLRAKLKKDTKFREDILAKKELLTDTQKLIFGVCDLPDTGFFPVACYLISL